MIEISENAARKIRTLMAKQGIAEGGLRVGVKGGGCSGLSYTFAWEKQARTGDEVFEGPAGAKGLGHGFDAAILPRTVVLSLRCGHQGASPVPAANQGAEHESPDRLGRDCGRLGFPPSHGTARAG